MDKESILKGLNDRNHFLKNYIQDNLPGLFYKRAFNKKIKQAEYIQAYEMTEDYKAAIHEFWEPYEKVNIAWHKAFAAISGIQDVRYIPEDVFYKTIEPTLNRYDLALAYTDKNMSDQLFSKFKMPETIIRNMNGNYYNANYDRIDITEAKAQLQAFAADNKFVIKPSIHSGAGKNVRVLDLREKAFAAIKNEVSELFKQYGQDFIVQAFLYQHELLENMHQDSLNTIRIISLRLNGKIHILSRVVRMGNNGSQTDNATSGCITSGFDERGKLHPYATDHWTYEKYKKHPSSHFTFENTTLPNVEACFELVKNAHEKLLYFDLVSWDIAIDRLGEPHLIEIGVNIQDINYHQRTNGPLFGRFTEKVLTKVYNPL